MPYGTEKPSVKTTYLKAIAGALQRKRKGEEPERLTWAQGELESLSLYLNAAPGWQEQLWLRIVLKDDQELIVIESGAASMFSRMFAGYAANVESGDLIRISADSPNSEHTKAPETTTTCYVARMDGDVPVKLAYERIIGETPGERVGKVAEIIGAHAAYVAYEPKQRSQADSSASKWPEAFYDLLKLLDGATVARGDAWPDIREHGAAYMGWIRRAVPGCEAAELAQVDQLQWLTVIKRVHQTIESGASLPTELQNLQVNEYDPFEQSK